MAYHEALELATIYYEWVFVYGLAFKRFFILLEILKRLCVESAQFDFVIGLS